MRQRPEWYIGAVCLCGVALGVFVMMVSCAMIVQDISAGMFRFIAIPMVCWIIYHANFVRREWPIHWARREAVGRE